VNFLHFLPSKICVSPTGVVSSLVPPLLRPTSPHRRTVLLFLPMGPRRAHCLCFIFWQCFIPPPSSQNKTEALNLHHHCRPLSPDKPTPTTLVTLPTTQPRLHFASSLARAPCHWSNTRCHRSLSPPSHTHRPSTADPLSFRKQLISM
jgi:hypothetical protein